MRAIRFFPLLPISSCLALYAPQKPVLNLAPSRQAQQLPVMPPPPPPPNDNGNDVDSVRLTDVLGTHRSLTTFSSLTRQQESITSLLSSLSHNTTVLAPLNSAIDDLPRKPWEDPEEYEALGAQAYEGGDGQERAQKNLRRFVEGHLVVAAGDDEGPWKRGQRRKTMAGKEVWWDVRKDGSGGGEERRVIMPDEVEVDRVASKVANGEVWILKGVLNYKRS